MEEKKSKIMELPIQENKEKSQKMSYEQLEQIAHSLSEQVRKLYSQVQDTNMNNMFKRLDYLFKVVENSKSFGEPFLSKCTQEIETIMTIPEEDINVKEK